MADENGIAKNLLMKNAFDKARSNWMAMTSQCKLSPQKSGDQNGTGDGMACGGKDSGKNHLAISNRFLKGRLSRLP
jgi:hypothetical protein